MVDKFESEAYLRALRQLTEVATIPNRDPGKEVRETRIKSALLDPPLEVTEPNMDALVEETRQKYGITNSSEVLKVVQDGVQALPEAFVPLDKNELVALLEAELSNKDRLKAIIRRLEYRELFNNMLKEQGFTDAVIDHTADGKPLHARMRYARHWLRFLRMLSPTITLDMTRSQWMKKHGSAKKNPLVPKDANIVDGLVILFKDGYLCLWWLPEGLDEFYRGIEGHKPLAPQAMIWDDELEKAFSEDNEWHKDTRHPADTYNQGASKWYKAKGFGWSAKHFGDWESRGNPRNRTAEGAGPYCHFETSNSKSSSKSTLEQKERRLKAVQKWLKQMLPVEESLSSMLEAADNAKWLAAKSHRDELHSWGTGTRSLSSAQCHLLLVRVRNCAVANHKDKDDIGLTATGTFGIFVGGDLCLPELNLRLRVRSSDVVVMDAAALAHLIAEFKGTRTSVPYLSKSGPNTVKQHINYMEDGPERNRMIAYKREKIAKDMNVHREWMRAEIALQEGYLGKGISIVGHEVTVLDKHLQGTPDGYKLMHVLLTKAELEKAEKAKAEIVNRLRKEENEIEEQETMATPASFFYKFGRQQQGRLTRDPDCNPFLSDEKNQDANQSRMSDSESDAEDSDPAPPKRNRNGSTTSYLNSAELLDPGKR